MNTDQKPASLEQIETFRQQHIGRLFIQAHRDFSVRSVAKLHARGHTGLTLAHTTLLSNLDTSGTRITTLADRAGMTKQSMGQLVVDLAKRGYVECIPDADDKRATIVRFTEAGHRFLADAYEIKHELENEYIALLGEEHFRLLSQMLNQIVTRSADPGQDASDLAAE